ncbi:MULTISPECIES: thioesterase family protein [Erwiniaceae]|uniref:4-hydroxybenzoyl-CoA thioesterase n=1 Tax=Pantoea rwandensis TaxID=1076550 RepID=A0ABM5RL39_9GAMM|nr:MULTISPECIES: thioesterase family protein [Erwiniaceae]AIR86716.1 4-hydroxybenzoyl-CoA thioesterase [Pantoea rwandensis]MBK0090432.1 acyl-CoA thioesterase [Erwinia sp. S59]MBK0125459.1 acyl-CoA thioesterase [Pantoea sp. S61]
MSEHIWRAEVEITVSFHDCDPMGVVWHGNYFRFFEVAREALLRSINYSYAEMTASGFVWPVVDTRVKYRQPLRCEEVIRVEARITEYENRLRIDYVIRNVAGQVTTKAHTLQVAVDAVSQEMNFVSPDILFERLGVKP